LREEGSRLTEAGKRELNGDVSFLGRREATAAESTGKRVWRRQNLDNRNV
jgi:hypothetical protein